MKFGSYLTCVTFLVFVVVSFAIVVPPTWSTFYHIKGSLHYPTSNVIMPFEGWFDRYNLQSRIDYYNGLDKTYQLTEGEGSNGTLYKIVLGSDSNENQFNITRCFRGNSMFVQPMLPDIQKFAFVEEVSLRDFDSSLFQEKRFDGSMREIRKFWVHYDKDKHAFPLRYDVRRYNERQQWMFLYEHFYVDYDYYDSSEKSIPDGIFKIREDILAGCHFEVDANGLDPMYSYVPVLPLYDPDDMKFYHFINKYNKVYDNRSETEYRKKIFHENLRFIEGKNRANLSFKLAVNHFADRTREEWIYLLGERHPTSRPQPLPKIFRDKSENLRENHLPDDFDWRMWGAVTPVKNQLSCGGCFAFSIAGLMESAYFIKTRKLVRFSEQAILDCSWLANSIDNSGCQGGFRLIALHWLKFAGGLPLDGDYRRFMGIEGFCDLRNVTMIAPIKDYYRVTPNDTDALRTAIIRLGPISTSINAELSSFIFYSSGVYYDAECSTIYTNHAVLIVGYGTDNNGTIYWIVKNSWGTNWGMDGYILISSYGNNCGVMTLPTFVELKDIE